MAQQVKKMARQNQSKPTASITAIPATTMNALEPMQKTHKKISIMERENMETMMHAADTCNKVAGELVGTCAENMNACAAVGIRAAGIFQSLGSEIMENCTRAYADYAEFSKDALACRTISDIAELQNKAAQRMFDNYFTMANKMYGILLNGCSEALEPLNDQAALAFGQVCKALSG